MEGSCPQNSFNRLLGLNTRLTFKIIALFFSKNTIKDQLQYLIYLQNKTIRAKVGQSAREICPDWTTRF